MFGNLSCLVSAFLVVCSALPALSAPMASVELKRQADDTSELAKRFNFPLITNCDRDLSSRGCAPPLNRIIQSQLFDREEAFVELAKRILVPECSGDPNTPKPAFCQQLNHPIKFGGPVAFKREEVRSKFAKRVDCARGLGSCGLPLNRPEEATM